MRTIDEALAIYLRKMDEMFAEITEKDYARMVKDNLAAEAIEDFQKLQAEQFRHVRADASVRLRSWLERGGEPLQ